MAAGKQGRSKGGTMYGKKAGGKGVQGSYYITKAAHTKLQKAVRRTGQSASNVIDFCLRASADSLTQGLARAIVKDPKIDVRQVHAAAAD